MEGSTFAIRPWSAKLRRNKVESPLYAANINPSNIVWPIHVESWISEAG